MDRLLLILSSRRQPNLVNIAPAVASGRLPYGDTALYRTLRTTQRTLLSESIAISSAIWRSHVVLTMSGWPISPYIPMRRGFVSLFAVLDWASRRVLAWWLSNMLTTDFFLDAAQEAVTRHGIPEIFNTDQGCQFTRLEFTGLLKDQGVQIRMDGRGCWRDNVFVQRPWRFVTRSRGLTYTSASIIMSGAHRAIDGRTPGRVHSEHLPARVTAA